MVEGAVVFSQPLADGRDSTSATLAVIVCPCPSHARCPFSVLLDEELAVEARFVRMEPGRRAVARDHDVRARIFAHGDLSHGMIASFDELRVVLSSPTSATLRAHGAAHIAKTLVLRNVDLRMRGDTTALRRHVGTLRLSGPASVFAHADGPIDDLAAVLSLDTDEPRVALHAAAHVYKNRIDLREPSACVRAVRTPPRARSLSLRPNR